MTNVRSLGNEYGTLEKRIYLEVPSTKRKFSSTPALSYN